jgi:hypothetical protein
MARPSGARRYGRPALVGDIGNRAGSRRGGGKAGRGWSRNCNSCRTASHRQPADASGGRLPLGRWDGICCRMRRLDVAPSCRKLLEQALRLEPDPVGNDLDRPMQARPDAIGARLALRHSPGPSRTGAAGRRSSGPRSSGRGRLAPAAFLQVTGSSGGSNSKDGASLAKPLALLAAGTIGARH